MKSVFDGGNYPAAASAIERGWAARDWRVPSPLVRFTRRGDKSSSSAALVEWIVG